MVSVVDLRPASCQVLVLMLLSNAEERLVKQLTDAVGAMTMAINGLRYVVAATGNDAVTRSDLNAAEARISAIIAQHGDNKDLAALAKRAQKISSRLKALSGKVTQLDSATDSTKTAP